MTKAVSSWRSCREVQGCFVWSQKGVREREEFVLKNRWIRGLYEGRNHTYMYVVNVYHYMQCCTTCCFIS